MKTVLTVFAALAVALALTGCGIGSSLPDPTVKDPEPEMVCSSHIMGPVVCKPKSAG